MITKNIKVFVDLDGTLNEFQEHFFSFIETLGYSYDYSKDSEYHMENAIVAPSKKDKKKILSTIMTDPFFWKTIPIQENSYEGLSYLNDNFSTYIVTSPWDEKNKDMKINWMEENYPFISPKQIIFCHDKWELYGNVIIEDKPDTLQKCSEKGFITIARFQPYNMDTHSDFFLHNWLEIPTIMEKVIKTIKGNTR